MAEGFRLDFDEVVDKVTPRIVKSGKQDVEFYKTMWGAIKSGKLFRAEIINKAKDGSYYNAEISIFPIKTEQGSIFIEVSRNITELKKAQAEIGAIQAREKQELERLVAERTQELQEKIEEVEKLNKYMIGRETKMAELKKEIENLKRINKLEER